MFVFFSNRLGCLGSLLVSLIGTALLLLLMRSCNASLRAPDGTAPPTGAAAAGISAGEEAGKHGNEAGADLR